MHIFRCVGLLVLLGVGCSPRDRQSHWVASTDSGEVARVQCFVHQQSRTLDHVYTNRAAFVASQVEELERAVNRATTDKLKAAFREELVLYRDGYNYVGKWSGWPIVLLWTPPSKGVTPSQFVVVCRSEKRQADILLLLRTDHELSGYKAVLDIVRIATHKIDNMTPREWAFTHKQRGPLFDGSGTIVDQDVLRAVGFTQFLQQR